MSFQQEIDSFLRGRSALELIQSFDTEFDIPFKQVQCIGLLEMLGAYAPPDLGNIQKLAEYIGAWWCRIVQADVSYNILDGLEAIRASKDDAEKLYRQVLENYVDLESPNDLGRKIAYIAVRWHDGAAKIHYRCNDHTEARLLFNKARKLAKQAGLWYCLPDIQSNCLRVEYEEHRAAGREQDTKLKNQYEECRDQTFHVAAERQISIPDPDSLSFILPQELHTIEFLRGLASIFHNLSVELSKIGNITASQEASHHSEVICRFLGDSYRLAQALNHQGRLALKTKDLQIARQRFEEITRLSWRRGQLIAQQNLAQINAQEGLYNDGLNQITALLEQVQVSNRRRGGDLGLDSDFYYFTVEAFKSILSQAAKDSSLDQKKIALYQNMLSEEQLQMVRSIRKVVKITTYKTAFSRRFYPIYQELVADRIKQLLNNLKTSSTEDTMTPDEEAFSLVEETSSRELLDLLQERTLSIDAYLASKLPPILYQDLGNKEIESEQEDKSNEYRKRRRSSFRTLYPNDNNHSVLELLNERRLLYENSSLSQPIATAEPNPDIAYEVRMFTANHPGLVIVRYFFYGSSKQRELAAYVFRDGKISFQQLDWQKINKEIIESWEKIWESKAGLSTEDCEELFSLLIEPLWQEITEGKDLDENCHLVLIPSEELFKIPLHTAFIPEAQVPLAAHVPLSYSVSATAYVTRGRHLLRRQRVEQNDDLCVLMKRDKQVSGEEIVNLTWPKSSFHIAGEPPEGLKTGSYQDCGKADRQGLIELIQKKPEFFTYAGHGLYNKALESVGPALELEGDCLTQFDIAMGVSLPRNKLALLGACVSGQGADLGGGEVAGFIRAFIAAGCGALGVTLWPVIDENIAGTIRHLLIQAQLAATSEQTFDVVKEIYKYYRDNCLKVAAYRAAERIEACPLALYL